MLTKENYFAVENQKKYWGSSQFKTFCECQARGVAEVNGEYERGESQALLQGQYLDALFEGDADLFAHQNKIHQRNGNLYAHFRDTETAYNFICDDEVMHALCDGQQQKIFTGKIQGVEFKIMIDSLHDDMIVDRKFVKDFKEIWGDGEYVSFWERWGYDIQAAIYQTIYAQNTGKKLPFILACVTKEKGVPNKEVFQFTQETIDNALDRVVSFIEHFDDVKHGRAEAYACGECEYCRGMKKIQKGEWVMI